MTEKLTILHLNDLHSHFESYPKIKRYLQEFPKSDEEVIRVDVGDSIDRWHPMTDITIHAHETSHMASKTGDKEWIEKSCFRWSQFFKKRKCQRI